MEQFQLQIKKFSSFALSNNAKAFLFALSVAFVGTLGTLQYRIYPWFKPITVNGLSSVLISVYCLPGLSCTVYRRRKAEGNHGTDTMSMKKRMTFIVIRAVFSSSSVIFYNLTLQRVAASLATIMTSLGPFLTIIASRILLKETITVLKVVAFVFTATGIILTAFLNDTGLATNVQSDLIMGIIFGLCNALLGVGSAILSKKLSSIDPLQIMFVDNFVGTLISAILILISNDNLSIPPCGLTAVILVIINSNGFVTGIMYLKAFKYGEASVLSPLMSGLAIVITFIYDVTFFGLVPPVLYYTAAILVLIGTLLNGFGMYLPRMEFLKKGL